MQEIFSFFNSPSLEQFQNALEKESSLLIEELWPSAKAALIALIAKRTKKNVVVITSERAETVIAQDLTFFTDAPILEFPSWETLPDEEIAPSLDIVGRRLQILNELLSNKTSASILFCPLQAILQRLPQPSALQKGCQKIHAGDEIPFASIEELLKGLGYRRTAVTSDKGEFSLRGGIVDLFPISAFQPYRLEFFGDTIESIRSFDAASQKSIEKVPSFFLSPAQEGDLLAREKNPATLFDYLKESTLLIFDDLLALEDRAVALKNAPSLLSLKELLHRASALSTLFFTEHKAENLSEVHYGKPEEGSPFLKLTFQMFDLPICTKRWRSPFLTLGEKLIPYESCAAAQGNELLELLNASSMDVVFISPSEAEESALKRKLKDKARYRFERGTLSSGFALINSPLALFPTSELTKKQTLRRTEWRRSFHTPAAEFHVLEPGDLVVHFHSGIGKFLGTEIKKDHLGEEGEFLVIEYAAGSTLFVPAAQSYLVSRYIGSHEETPLLHTLGSKKWQRTKEKTQASLVGYAHDLLRMQAEREMAGGYPFPPDSDDLLLFEEEFPFVETADQKSAIAKIKQEMCLGKAMDHLLCGDVGYGKTEVAMRAAFKAAFEGRKQVAVLVPTTVLALQHYETFTQRMQSFPLTIEMVSRFKTPKQIKQSLNDLKEGRIDILIGTHRLLSKDVKFKDLGLMIIDEEQRFGVRAKEHLKKLKKGVDCLSLSATPIPRTLYLSLIGARAISTINTPPHDRLPVKTIIAERDDKLIQNALLRERSRCGQAFFIHNRIETIHKVSSDLKKLLPEARIVTAHGQMSSDELDTLFHTFKEGEADIFVSTTIVENGVDVPHANTILIDDAHRFGLSELYQLRGRVGRWNRAAYAYLLIPKKKSLPEIVQKRLHALVESSGFGGGIKVALRDLEIRGAGDILGAQQSGHVSNIGFHLYCKLLKQTVEALKKKSSPTFTEAKIELPFAAHLPPSYINEASLRMELYHRLGEANAASDVDALLDEMHDRFGPPPKVVLALATGARLRILANTHRLSLLKIDRHTCTIKTLAGSSRTFSLKLSSDLSALEKSIASNLET